MQAQSLEMQAQNTSPTECCASGDFADGEQSVEKRMTILGLMVERLQQEVKVLKNVRAKCEGKNVRATQKCEGNLTPQLEPKQYDPNDGLMHDFEADPISDQKRMDTLGLLVERLQQEVKVLKQEVASRDAIIEAKNEVITTQKEAISIATNQLSAATAAMESVAVYLNKGAKKPSTPPAALSASDVDASG